MKLNLMSQQLHSSAQSLKRSATVSQVAVKPAATQAVHGARTNIAQMLPLVFFVLGMMLIISLIH